MYVNSEPTLGDCAEIVGDGGDVINNVGADLEDDCSCFAGKNDGKFTLGAGKTVTLSNEAFMEASSNGKLRLENGSKIIVNNGSEEILKTGGQLEIPSGAHVEIEINSGGSFILDEALVITVGGTLSLTGSGTVVANDLIVVNSGGTLNIGAGLHFQMGTDVYLQANGNLNVN